MTVPLSPGDAPDIVTRLRAAGCVFAEEEAGILLSTANSPLDLERMVEDRVRGLPLEHLVGWAEFCGLRIEVDAGVFVPRRRTEFLVREALDRTVAEAVVVDLCCGSGAVGVAIAAQRPGIHLFAADIDPIAVACARRNIGGAGQVFAGDLFDALPDELYGRIDVLACNTPYVPTDEIRFLPPEARDYEPRGTLDGGPDGLAVQRRVARLALAWLAPGGSLLVESSERQAPVSAEIFARCGLLAEVAYSEEEDATIVVGTRPGD